MVNIRKIIGILVVIFLLICLAFVIKNCNKDENVELELELYPEKIEIENRLKAIQADAIIEREVSGGECIEKFYYYICYDKNEIYEYEIFIYVPLVLPEEVIKKSDKYKGHNRYELNKYEVSVELMSDIKQFVQDVQNNAEASYGEEYTLKIGDNFYNIEDSVTIEKLLTKIKR